MARGFVLTFHSHNIAGTTYATNDHVALDETLGLLRRLRIPILRLLEVATRLRQGTFDALPEQFASITFDDGTDYDWAEMRHANHGMQPSMYSILRKHSHRLGPWWLRKACATSFVIASPAARSEMEAALPVRLSDTWWREAQSSSLLDIGSHGWNHVHPLVSDMKERPQLVEAFHRIDSMDEARLQMDSSFDFIRGKAGGDSARLFAYPYGQVSEFIATEYFPHQHRYLAACATSPEPLRKDSDPWRIPRYVCGWHWKSPEELEQMLRREPEFAVSNETNRRELGALSLIEVDDATKLAGPLFRRAFQQEIPRFPRHFVLLHRTPQGEIPIGYAHHTKSGNAYLGGGLVVSALEFRKLDRETAEMVRREGGFAEWIARTSCEWLEDADAVFLYMGDAKSIRINTRVGFVPTQHRYLHVLWKRQIPPDEQKRLIDRIAAIGAF